MWLLASQDEDAEAVWLADRLIELGLNPLEHVTATDLVHDVEWEHRVSSGGARTVLRLGDGRLIDSGDVDAVLNRLSWVTAEGFGGASNFDREYAGEELRALALSWLEGFGAAAVNRPSSAGLCGPFRPDSHWRWIAAQAGLPARPCAEPADAENAVRNPDRRWLLIIDGSAVPLGAADGDGPTPDARRLTDALGLDVFSAGFERSEAGDWELCTVDLLPSFFSAGDEAVEALVALLRQRAGRAA
jgi:hypothetical protein